jgi:thiamine monophosphate synthase
MIRQVRAIYSGPLVAIGGITPENCALVWQAGADSVAVISGWLEAQDPLTAAERFVERSRRQPQRR